MKTYISAPLHGIGDLPTARRFYELLADACTECGCAPYVPHHYTDPQNHSHLNEAEVFRRDLSAVRDADLLVACIGTASSGVGAEIGIAYAAGKPIVALHHEKESPSRFLLGLLACSPRSRVVRFATLSDCLAGLRQCLRSNLQ